MRRWSTVMVLSLALIIGTQAVAFAGGDRHVGHGSDVVQGAAKEGVTSGSVWTENGTIHRIVVHESQCWYPQSWLEDATVNGTASPYYPYVWSVGFDPAWFSDTVPAVGGDSCVQHVYSGIGSCTDEDRIGVRAIDTLWDARQGTIGSFGNIGLHEYPDRYCLEVVTRDRWKEIVDASDLLPRPVRATYPAYRTLVGLDNQVWYQVDNDADRYQDGFDIELPTAGITYNLTVNIWLQQIRIDINGDGTFEHTVVCSTGDAATLIDCGGSLDNPIYDFIYQQRAFHPFTIETAWAGIAIDENGITHTLDPDLLTVDYTFDWETIEVRSSLDR